MAALSSVQGRCAPPLGDVRPHGPRIHPPIPHPLPQKRLIGAIRNPGIHRISGATASSIFNPSITPPLTPTASPGPAGDGATAAEPQAPAALPSVSTGDLLRARLPDGHELYVEVVKCRPGAVEAVCEGEALKLRPDGTAEPAGHWPRLNDAWVKAQPALATAIKDMRRRQEDVGTAPSALLSTAAPGSVIYERIMSLEDLEVQVDANPGPWCDGTAPGDPDPTRDQTALLSAGELIAFLQGARGVALVQLDLPESAVAAAGPRAPLPLARPFVLRLLQRALAVKGAVAMPSTAPGGGASSLVLAAKQQPFKAWGAALAGVGVQAALVADSPYYKLLVGRILGYKEANIVHHIESKGQKLDARVAAAVAEELRSLSAAEPRLPWTTGRR